MDRRAFLRTTGAAAGAASLIPAITAQGFAARPVATTGGGGGSNNRPEITSTLAPWAPAPGDWNVTTINHLYRRAGFGATYAEITAAKALTPSAAIDALLDDSLLTGNNLPQPPEHAADWLHVPPYLGSDYNTIVAQQTAYTYAVLAIRRQWISLMADPKTMLRERMTLFWLNHFVIEEQKVYYPQMIYNYVSYFRQHPWGNFKQMVKDVTISPAMLIYLDGQYSAGATPNENYARELMELFTLGVSYYDGTPNYTETDIQQLARALTGWRIDNTASAPNVLPSIYDVSRHDSTLKSPFGAPKKDYGLAASGVVTDDVIDLLFSMKGDRLAWYVCSKLYQQFVYHDITTTAAISIITGMADTFKTNWELKPVLSQLLKSEHFFDMANVGAEIKSPLDFFVGLMRSLDLTVDQYQAGSLYYYAYYSNQWLLDPPNVKGWPGYHSWISTTTLPQRNGLVGALAISASPGIPAVGGTGYDGKSDTGFQWTDAAVTAWAQQFPSYTGQFSDFLNEVSQYLCAIQPSKTALTAKILNNFPNSYEWPTLLDKDKLVPLRLVVSAIAQFANYQLT